MPETPIPVPQNEPERVLSLAKFDIDYSNIESNFKGLAVLAAQIAGTPVSLISLIDSFTQWTIASHGLTVSQTPREESICQYTIAAKDYFEVPDLSADERFKEKIYVTGPLKMKYYFGIPLTTADGLNIGSLCVVDSELRILGPEKLALLKLIADETINRLENMQIIDTLRNELAAVRETQKKVIHEIRGPIAGIIGLAGLISYQGVHSHMEEMLESMSIIHKSSSSVLELADEILTTHQEQPLKGDEFNLVIFKDKLERLYLPQALHKGISFKIKISEKTGHIAFSKHKLLQIAGNLIYNAIRFTPEDGTVNIELDLKAEATYNLLKIKVTDSVTGMDEETIAQLMDGPAPGNGIGNKDGFGFGLSLVKQLIETLNGEFRAWSDPESGATFEIIIRQMYV